MLVALGLLLAWTVAEARLAPAGREAEYARTLALLKRGPYAREHGIAGLFFGLILPIALLVFGGGSTLQLAGLLALVGLWTEKSLLVRAGQALPIS